MVYIYHSVLSTIIVAKNNCQFPGNSRKCERYFGPPIEMLAKVAFDLGSLATRLLKETKIVDF